ncbi:MAG: hypothetical protein CMM47_07835 [Rhodospirillaceae bacterium]|nr:hypothetical protein [Rhodospirillaceae bacterium]
MISFRLLYEADDFRRTGVGVQGIHNIHWAKLVPPGDTICPTWEIMTLKEPISLSQMGNVPIECAILYQDEELLMTIEALWILK